MSRSHNVSDSFSGSLFLLRSDALANTLLIVHTACRPRPRREPSQRAASVALRLREDVGAGVTQTEPPTTRDCRSSGGRRPCASPLRTFLDYVLRAQITCANDLLERTRGQFVLRQHRDVLQRLAG